MSERLSGGAACCLTAIFYFDTSFHCPGKKAISTLGRESHCQTDHINAASDRREK